MSPIEHDPAVAAGAMQPASLGLPGTAGVLTLADYKKLRKITSVDAARDEQFTIALEIANDIIVDYTNRQFNAEPTVRTRKYRYDTSGILDIDDCNAITSVVLSNRSLVLGKDYWVGPENGPTSYWLEFSWRGQWPAYSQGQMGFTRNEDKLGAIGSEADPFIFVEVTATFGWPRESIPGTIKQAAAWLVDEIAVKRPEPGAGAGGQVSAESIADLSYSYQIEAQAVTAELPPRIRALLDMNTRPQL